MPHQIIEYSANLDQKLDIAGLVLALHQCAATLEPLPLAGLRTRAYPTRDFAVADRHPDNAFIAVYLRIAEGRPLAVRQALGEALFQCLTEYTAELFALTPIALSYELQEIDPITRWNQNNLKEHLQSRAEHTGADPL
ncbi:MAG: hypothetical protein ACR2PZ_14205 [Pseudomonadales bacterium]